MNKRSEYFESNLVALRDMNYSTLSSFSNNLHQMISELTETPSHYNKKLYSEVEEKYIHSLLIGFLNTAIHDPIERESIIEGMMYSDNPTLYINSIIEIPDDVYKKIEEIVLIRNKIKYDTSLEDSNPKIKKRNVAPKAQVDELFKNLKKNLKAPRTEKFTFRNSLVARRSELCSTPYENQYSPVNQSELNNIIKEHRNTSNYTLIDLSNCSATAISINRANKLIITGKVNNKPITINGSNNIQICDLDASITSNYISNRNNYTSCDSVILAINSCNHIYIKNSYFHGGLYDANQETIIMNGMTQSTPKAVILRPKGVSITTNSKNVFATDNYLENILNAFEIVNSSRIHFEGNIAHYLISDMFHCNKVTDLTITHNYRGKGLAYQLAQGHRLRINAKGIQEQYDGKTHSDFVQIFAQKGDTTPSRNIHIYENYDACIAQSLNDSDTNWVSFCQQSDPLVEKSRATNHAVGLQGIFIRSEVFAVNQLQHQNINIENNHLYNTQHNPYTVLNSTKFRIVNNFCTTGKNFNTSSNTPTQPNIEGVTNIIRANPNAYISNNYMITDGVISPLPVYYN
ncbi:MAG: hypothetical protein WAQ53_15550 [Thiofilum sp.]|uniref:hypothetical protein n=1 Tax=Thiofilum sp. TaxID=2212733 RepID=UPI0025F021F1|nr:hypothetical protein [Thiofilum sp.]MBK8455421.1 hypothetical protein [Thiofilum sp.]